MNVIGKQIKKYRITKGLTQEALGNLIGVTTQAVSKWERGGTPDANLLPYLADALNVSIDALYGREEPSVATALARRICHMSEGEAYRRAFDICWALELGLARKSADLEDFLEKFIDPSVIGIDNGEKYAKLVQNDGLTSTRLTSDFRYFFMMTEPEKGLNYALSDAESLGKVFEIFANENILKILWCLYARRNTPIATSLISKNTGLGIHEVDRCMDILCAHNLAMCNSVAVADGEICCYMFCRESTVVPFLCFADEIARHNSRDFLGLYERTTPLFK